jgi:hypothetical protein
VLQISIGTAEGLKELILASRHQFDQTGLYEDGYGQSDHTSFYEKYPGSLLFTGLIDYHKPSDTWDKINYPGMVSISSLIFNVADTLASSPERLSFSEAGPKPETGRITRKKMITLGIMPDFAGNVKTN